MSQRERHISAALIYRARLRDGIDGESRDWLGFMLRHHRALAKACRRGGTKSCRF